MLFTNVYNLLLKVLTMKTNVGFVREEAALTQYLL